MTSLKSHHPTSFSSRPLCHSRAQGRISRPSLTTGVLATRRTAPRRGTHGRAHTASSCRTPIRDPWWGKGNWGAFDFGPARTNSIPPTIALRWKPASASKTDLRSNHLEHLLHPFTSTCTAVMSSQSSFTSPRASFMSSRPFLMSSRPFLMSSRALSVSSRAKPRDPKHPYPKQAQSHHQHPSPSSPTSVPRLPRLRSGTQGPTGAATPTNLLHTPTHPFTNLACRGVSRGRPPGRSYTPHPSGNNPLFRRAGLRSGTHGGRAKVRGHTQTTTTPFPLSFTVFPDSDRGPRGLRARLIHQPRRNLIRTFTNHPCRGVSCGRPPGRSYSPHPSGNNPLFRRAGLRSGTHGGRAKVLGHTQTTTTPFPLSFTVFPDSDRGPRGLRARYPKPASHPHTRTPANHACRGVGTCAPAGDEGNAATPPTCHPLPTSGILPNRLPRLRSGTQGRRGYPHQPATHPQPDAGQTHW